MKQETTFNYIASLKEAHAVFQFFICSIDKTSRVVVLHDSDADGVAAGVVLARTLERIGFTNVARLAPDRERNAWTKENRARVQRLEPAALFVLD